MVVLVLVAADDVAKLAVVDDVAVAVVVVVAMLADCVEDIVD